MKKRSIIALTSSLLITIIPLPLSTALADPMTGMGILVFYFFILMPLFFLFLGGYLGKFWRMLWWIPMVTAVFFTLLGILVFDTWQFVLYVPGYFILGYGAMAVSAWTIKCKGRKETQIQMDLQDL